MFRWFLRVCLKKGIIVASSGRELICITNVQLVRLGQYPSSNKFDGSPVTRNVSIFQSHPQPAVSLHLQLGLHGSRTDSDQYHGHRCGHHRHGHGCSAPQVGLPIHFPPCIFIVPACCKNWSLRKTVLFFLGCSLCITY